MGGAAVFAPPAQRGQRLEKYFPAEMTESAWLPKLKEIIPSYGVSLIDDAALTRKVRAATASAIKLENV